MTNLTTRQFGAWTVIADLGIHKNARRYLCRCACGVEKPVYAASLKSGQTLSCKPCGAKRQGLKIRTHGESFHTKPSKEYTAYSAAKKRCNNPTDKDYPRYGGRGIMFCFETFQAFLDEVGRAPTPTHSLDRINNNKGYEVGNLAWHTPSEQQRNRRSNRLLTIDGITKTTIEWANSDKIVARNIGLRLFKGWCHFCAVHLQSGKGQAGCPHRLTGIG